MVLAVLVLNGCGGGEDSAPADPKALKSVGWYYQNLPPDFFNDGVNCLLSISIYLADTVSFADVHSFEVRAPNGIWWDLPAAERRSYVGNSGSTVVPLLLSVTDTPQAFPLAGVWTVTVRLKNGTASTLQSTFHDPGTKTPATYPYLYTPEDWSPGSNMYQYVAALRRFPSTGYTLRYDAANGRITSTGFAATYTAYQAAEPKAYNMFCWLFDQDLNYLGFTTPAYSITDHSSLELIAQDGELSILPGSTVAVNDGGRVDLATVKYARIVVRDGAQFAPESYASFDNQSVSTLVPVAPLL